MLQQNIKMQNIFLIGMMGSGKSYIGNLLAHKMGLPFFDIDIEIEKIMDISIDEIFKNYGEERFRLIEKALFREMSKNSNFVYATGGGIVLDKENQAILTKNGISIFLDCSIDLIIKRINKQGNRPLYKDKESLELIYDKRKQLYLDCSDFKINVNSKTSNEIINNIEQIINEKN